MKAFKNIILLFIGLSFIFTNNAKAYTPSDTLIAYIAQTPPDINGDSSDACWTKAKWYPIDQLWLGSSMKEGDFSGRYKVVWDKDYLYLLADITDDSLSDDFNDPLLNYWADDCLEIFLDEDHSGGDQQYNYNAFSYHVSTNGDAVDLGSDFSVVSLNDNLDVMIRKITKHRYIWEFAIKIYSDQFDLSDPENSRMTLSANKILGLTLGYCDNDETASRENFIGSIQMPEGMEDFNWIMADYFGTLLLYDPNVPMQLNYKHNVNPVSIYQSSGGRFLNVRFEGNIYKEVRLYDINGRLLKKSGINNINNYQFTIDELSQGLYLVGLRNNIGKEKFYKALIF